MKVFSCHCTFKTLPLLWLAELWMLNRCWYVNVCSHNVLMFLMSVHWVWVRCFCSFISVFDLDGLDFVCLCPYSVWFEKHRECAVLLYIWTVFRFDHLSLSLSVWITPSACVVVVRLSDRNSQCCSCRRAREQRLMNEPVIYRGTN